MRLLFAGTPEAALPSLRALLDSRHEVVGVLTRADAPSGRGRTLRPSPVRALADEAGIPVLTPRSLRDPQVQQQLRSEERRVGKESRARRPAYGVDQIGSSTCDDAR